MKTILAIDPGASGGVAIRNRDAALEAAHKMWDTEGDVVEGLRHYIACSDNPTIYLEQVGGFIGKPQPGSAMFKFGRNFGFLLGAAQAFGYRIVLVRPQDWQKTLGLGNKGSMSKTEWKNKLKQKAQQLYPHINVTLATADALLILEHAKQKEKEAA